MPKRSRPSVYMRLDELLKFKLQRHIKWPNLKVSDWQLLAREHWHLEENIMSTDPRYRMIHDFCKNEKVRQRKKALKPHQEPDERMMVHEDLEPVLDHGMR